MNNNTTPNKNDVYKIDNLAKKSFEITIDLLKESLENLDLEIKNKPERKSQYKIKGIYPRTITTRQGTVTFNRRLYINKETGEYIFLLDYLIGVNPYSRLSDDAIIAIAEASVELKSYASAGKYALSNTIVSRQTVFNCLKKIEFVRAKKANKIESDVIHISIDGFYANYAQFQRKIETKFANIFTGKIQVDKNRNQLVNKTIINQTNSKNFSKILEKELNDNYSINENTKIYICGDGASWIKQLTESFPNSQYVIDKFHYMRYLRQLPDHTKALKDFKEGKIDEIKKQYDLCTSEFQKECINYVVDLYEYTKAWNNDDFICCAAENVVSHVYNLRIRAVPRNWKKNLYKISTALALATTGSLETIIKESDDNDEIKNVDDLFRTYNFDNASSNMPILQSKRTIKVDALRSLTH